MDRTTLPVDGSSPDPLGGRRLVVSPLAPAQTDAALRALLDAPGVGPDVPPNPSTSVEPLAPPPGFVHRFGVAARRYTEAVAVARRRGRAIRWKSTAGRPWREVADQVDRLERLYNLEAAALRRLDRAEGRLAEVLRGLTGGRPVRMREWEVEGGPRCESWATVRWGGAWFGLDDRGNRVIVRPAAVALDLDGPA